MTTKIGVFDSGLGGLLIARSIIQLLPHYDYLYLGDTARVPYGTRSRDTVFAFTREAVDYMFRQGCELIVVACNTASADALRRIQQEYLPLHYPDRRVLGVLIPAAEAAVAVGDGPIGVLATQATVSSGAFIREITKLRPDAIIIQKPAPLLVSLIEMGGVKFARPIVEEYVAPLRDAGVRTLILGCTHYPVLKGMIEECIGPGVSIIDQNDVVPVKLSDYLSRHPEIESRLSRTSERAFQVTDYTETAAAFAEQLFDGGIELETVASLG